MAEAVAKNPAVYNVVYPITEGSKFDLDYYLKSHMPMVNETWEKKGLTGWTVVKLDSKSGYQIQATLEFESVEKMTIALQETEVVQKVMGDVPNFTNETPLSFGGAIVAKK